MKDFLLDENGDLKIENGTLVIGNCEEQNQALLLKLPKGAIKEHPGATVGIMNYLESEDPAALLLEIRQRYTDDGMVINKLGFNDEGKLIIDAVY